MSGIWSVDWKWLAKNVGLPILAPIFLAGMMVFVWGLGDSNFSPDPWLVIDLTPWAISIYVLTLFGMHAAEIVDNRRGYPWTTGIAAVSWLANVLVFAVMVVWRHDSAWKPDNDLYVFVVILGAVAIYSCYQLRERS